MQVIARDYRIMLNLSTAFIHLNVPDIMIPTVFKVEKDERGNRCVANTAPRHLLYTFRGSRFDAGKCEFL